MKYKIIGFYLVLLALSMPATSWADLGFYQSIEWKTTLAERIGIYHVERVHDLIESNKNSTNATEWQVVDFKLTGTLWGNPEDSFSRTNPVFKPVSLGFHEGDDYIFFFAGEDRLKYPLHPRRYVASDQDEFFCNGNYVCLKRKNWSFYGTAIDCSGRLLTNRLEIINLVKSSLKLPPAALGIDHSAYFYSYDKSLYPEGTNFNFSIIQFPNANTRPAGDMKPTMFFDVAGLIIPSCLASKSKTNSAVTRSKSG